MRFTLLFCDYFKFIKYRPLRLYRKLHLLFIPRMSKGKLPGAESYVSLAGHLRSGRIVFQIAQKRRSMSGKLNADLMVASCLQIDFHEAERALLSLQLLQDPIALFRPLRIGYPLIHNFRNIIFPVFPQIIHVCPKVIHRFSTNNSQILFLHLMPGNMLT